MSDTDTLPVAPVAPVANGLYHAPDPSSQIACTIGGNVAENAGDVHCLKYGLTLHNLLQARGFTVVGETVTFGSEAPDSPGLDLLAPLVGSEGTLAVTIEVIVKLIPKPQLARCIMASLADVEAAGNAVASIIAAGIIPAGLELMDRHLTAAAEDFVHAGYNVSRLMAGSMGVLCEVSLKVLPQPAAQTTIEFDVDQARALAWCDACLWRLALPAGTPPLALAGTVFFEWGGSQRWLHTAAPATAVRAAAAAARGHARLFRGSQRPAEVFAPLPAPLLRIHKALKQALDPAGLFNPGRL